MTILNEKLVSITIHGAHNLFIWGFMMLVFAFIVFIAIGVSISKKNRGALIASILFAIPVVIFFYLSRPQSAEFKQYDVLVDEQTTFHEIMDNYDLIAQDGAIYTIRAKEPENGE